MKIIKTTVAEMLMDRALGLDMPMPKITPRPKITADREPKWKPGDVVYRMFSPATVGLVVGSRWGENKTLYETSVYTWIITVRQPSGKTYEYSDLSLMDYRALVADHKRKAEKHEAKLRQIIGGKR